MHWILLRGLGREHGHWGDLPDRLRNALPGDRVHALDLPGTGWLWQRHSPARIQAMLPEVEAQAEAIAGPVALVGLSMGAMLALAWADHAPRRFACLALINPSSRLNPPWQRLRLARWPRVMRLLLQRSAVKREAGILSMVSNQAPQQWPLQEWQSIAKQRPVPRRDLLCQLLAASRYQPPTHLTVPGAILVSQTDRLVHPECSHALAKHLSWPLHSHPTAGHDLPLDAPDWLVAQLGDLKETLIQQRSQTQTAC